MKHTRQNILSLMRNRMIKRRICFIHRDVSTGYDEIKVALDKTIYKKNYIDQTFNLIDQRRNCF